MQDLIQSLVLSGLPEKESKLYVLLLKSGSTSMPSLCKKIRVSKSQVERLVAVLETRGLAWRRQVGSKIVVTPADPKLILESVEDDAVRLSARKEHVTKLIEPLRLLGVKASAKPELHFFVGQEGARAALDDTLTSREKTLKAFFSMADLSDFVGAEYFEHYSRKRIATGYNLQAIRTFERDKRGLPKQRARGKYLSSKEERLDVRFVSEDLAFPLTLFLYDHRVLAISSKEENFAFMIESKELCHLQKKLFELTWRSIAIRSISSPPKK